jgi:inhibitor of cysteine peptidase
MQTLQLTMNDNGKIINASAEAVIFITLEGNATTGYRWEPEEIKHSIVSNVQHHVEAASSMAAGAGGSFVFRLSGLKPGSSKVALKYWKPWEGDNSILKRFEITLHVS